MTTDNGQQTTVLFFQLAVLVNDNGYETKGVPCLFNLAIRVTLFVI